MQNEDDAALELDPPAKMCAADICFGQHCGHGRRTGPVAARADTQPASQYDRLEGHCIS